MSTTNAVYTKGSLAKELNLLGLVRNQVVDGIVEEGQAEYAITKIIEESNAKYEAAGTGNKILPIYKDEVAYTGDPTIQSQVQSVVALGGGVIRINFSDPNYQGFRNDDRIDTKFNGNQAKVVEAGNGFIKVSQAEGFTAPVVGDFAAGKVVIQRTRAINARGTLAPQGVYQLPQTWENYCSIIDDGGQESLFDSLNQTVISQAGDYISIAPIKQALGRFFRNMSMNYFTSRKVNPATNGMNFSATSGIIEQIKDGGTYVPLNSVVTKAEFENYVAQWFLSNPHNNNSNRVIKTGRIGMAQIGEWYKDYMKFDYNVAISFTDGSVNGLNATKIFIAGFGFVQVMHDMLQDMNLMGERSSISGYAGMPKTSGDFYFFDFSPVRMQTTGATAPALQKIYLKNKYFFAFNQGLKPTESLASAMTGGTALTMDSLELTSTTADFNSFRIYSICGINVMNRSAHVYLENKV
jgi:hypothetical protein